MLHAHSIKVRCMYIKIPDDHDVFIIYMLFACHLHVNTDVIRQGDALESKAIINWWTGERTNRGNCLILMNMNTFDSHDFSPV